MNSGLNPFVVLKDQFLSSEYLSFQSQRSMVNNGRRYSFQLARNAIYHALRWFGTLPRDRVLVPAFICDAAVRPIIACGAEPVYYRVSRDCAPDLNDVERKLQSGARALISVHYFGFPRFMEELLSLCRKNNAALLEDCAHVLEGAMAGSKLGTMGDASVFSWRKFLPVSDGGELVLNSEDLQGGISRRAVSWTQSARALKSVVEQAILSGEHEWIAVPYRKLDALKNSARRRAHPANGLDDGVVTSSGDVDFRIDSVDFPASPSSRWIARHSVVERVASQRRSNYMAIAAELSSIGGVQLLYPALPPDVCPWVLPVFIEGMPNAHLPLRSMGIPAVTWGFVRPHGISEDVRADTEFLYENLIFLPVHQNLRPTDLERIVTAVKHVRATLTAACS